MAYQKCKTLHGKTAGVITLKKGKYKKGKYKVKLKISATASLNTLTRTVIIRIK